jgi:predicted nucleic acid-binding protein
MNFGDVPAGVTVFVDANIFIFYFGAHPIFGPRCQQLLDRIDNHEIGGATSSVVLSEVNHRLMTLEISNLLGWPMSGCGQRLKRHPAHVMNLTHYRKALDEISLLGLQVLAIGGPQVSAAAHVCRQSGLLTNDALIVAAMREHGLTHLASNDSDFDRVPGLLRYAPL